VLPIDLKAGDRVLFAVVRHRGQARRAGPLDHEGGGYSRRPGEREDVQRRQPDVWLLNSFTPKKTRRLYDGCKDVKFSSEAREKMLRGSTRLPCSEGHLAPRPQYRRKSFAHPASPRRRDRRQGNRARDRFENMVRNWSASCDQDQQCRRDGTTTATVLAQAIVKERCQSVAAGMHPTEAGHRSRRRAVSPTQEPRPESDLNDETRRRSDDFGQCRCRDRRFLADAMQRVRRGGA